jgi:hypothetical protein
MRENRETRVESRAEHRTWIMEQGRKTAALKDK